jgi:hypothetical protein
MRTDPKRYLGIDIGLSGAFALIHDGDPTGVKMPVTGKKIDAYDIVKLIDDYNPDHVVFEDLGVIFGSSKKTALSMGYQSGVIEAACICAGIPYTKVKAKMWQKDMFVGVAEAKNSKGKRDTKAMALIACKRIFPGLELTLSDRATKAHDGYVDAILMAEWARRKNL